MRMKSKNPQEIKGLQGHSKCLRKLSKRRAQKAEKLCAHHDELGIEGQTDGLQYHQRQGRQRQPDCPRIHLIGSLFSHSMSCISVLLKHPPLLLPSRMALCSLDLSWRRSPWAGDCIIGRSTSWQFPAGWVGSSHHPDSCFLMF